MWSGGEMVAWKRVVDSRALARGVGGTVKVACELMEVIMCFGMRFFKSRISARVRM